MRPLDVQLPTAAYDPTAQRDRIVGQQRVGSDPPARLLSVGAYADEAQARLDAAWVPTGAWTDPDAEREWAADLASMGDGWEDAIGALLDAVGPYCAFCEAPLQTAPGTTHLLPPSRFPSAAFSADNLLLACAPCRAARGDQPNQATLRMDSAAAAAAIVDPTRFAWPSRYWRSLPSTAVLPVRYDLVVVRRDVDRLERVRLVLPTEYPFLVAAWRAGRLTDVDGALLLADVDRYVEEGSPAGTGTLLAAHVAPSGGPLAGPVESIVGLFALNQVRAGEGLPIDRRVNLRTRAFLEALSQRAAFDTTVRNGGTLSPDDLATLLRPVVAGSGFWGVWYTVFADVPGIATFLAGIFPGMPSTRWIV